MNDFIKFSKDEADNNFRGEFTMTTGLPQKVQYIPTIAGVPITPEKPSPKPVIPPVVVIERGTVKQKYLSVMNKGQLIEVGNDYGLEFTSDMTRKIMQDKINEAKKNGNGTGVNKGIVT